jgi:hypothetical protein
MFRSRVVDELKTGTSQTQAIGYIYFDYNDPNSFQLENIVRSLLKQLLFNLQIVPETIEGLYDGCLQKGEAAGFATLKEQLLSNLTKFRRALFLFDALDEVSTEYIRDIMALISDFRNAQVKVFCTSRINTSRVREELGGPTVTEIYAKDEDIAQYIRVRLDREYDYDEESKQQIVDALVKKAEGKYFLTQCHG